LGFKHKTTHFKPIQTGDNKHYFLNDSVIGTNLLWREVE